MRCDSFHTRGLLVLYCLLLLGCRNGGDRYSQPRFSDKREVSVEIIAGPLPFTMASAIEVTGPYLVAMAADVMDHSFCHIFDKSGQLLCNTLREGRGPGELLALEGNLSVRNGRVEFLDRLTKTMFSFDVDSLLMALSSGLSAPIESYSVFSLLKAEDYRNDFHDMTLVHQKISPRMVESGEEMRRLSVFDDLGNLVSRFDSFAEEDEWKNWADTYHFSISPDGTKLAVVPTWSGTLELFDLPGLTPIYVGYFAPQEFESPSGSVSLTEKSAIQFSDIVSSDKEVYAVWGGDVAFLPNRELPEELQAIPANKIDVFDWKGKPVKQIITDYRVHRVCLDESAGCLYAIVSDKEESYYLGRIVLTRAN